MKFVTLGLIAALAAPAFADQLVNGYVRKDGTYVAPHLQSAPDNNAYNNYSSKGNTNPYTGQAGTRDPYQVQQQYSRPYPNQQPVTQPRRNAW
jgi:hypothetical protein